MNDKELADKVVSLGVGEYVCDVGKTRIYSLYDDNGRGDCTGAYLEYEHDEFVRDWRVAGALMEERARSKDRDTRTIALSFGPELFCATAAGSSTPTYGVYLERSNESAPRAIIEACVAAPLPDKD